MAQTLEGILPANADTLLTISGTGADFGTMLYQARGLTQTLVPIKESAQYERTINARLRDVSNPIFRKFQSKISCTDINVPPLDNIWPGMEVTVGCAIWMSYLTGRPGSPCRNEVSGSSYVLGDYTYYRPEITFLVTPWSLQWQEWKAESVWELGLEEV